MAMAMGVGTVTIVDVEGAEGEGEAVVQVGFRMGTREKLTRTILTRGGIVLVGG